MSQELLCKFDELTAKYNSANCSRPIEYSLKLFPKGYDLNCAPHLTVGVGIHGNEQHSIHALNDILVEFESPLQDVKKPVLFVLGNPQAVKINKRYVECDLNRQFKERVDVSTYEGGRAKEILSVASGTRYLLDIHSTTAFLRRPYGIFPDRDDLVEFMVNLGTDISDIILVPVLSPEEGQCFDEYFYTTDKSCTPITIEVGHIGESKAATTRAKNAILGALYATGVLEGECAKGQTPALWIDGQVVKQTKESEITLVPGLENFQPSSKGDILAYNKGSPIMSSCDGVIIFPTYNDPKAKDLVRVAIPKRS